MTTKTDARVINLGGGMSSFGAMLQADFVLLKNITIASPVAAVDLKDFDLNADFDNLRLIVIGAKINLAGLPALQFSNDNGATFLSSAAAYRAMNIFVNDTGSSNGATTTATYASISNTTQRANVGAFYDNLSAVIDIPINRYATDNQKYFVSMINANATPNQVGGLLHGMTGLAFANLNALRLMLSTAGSYTEGRIMLYGQRKRSV